MQDLIDQATAWVAAAWGSAVAFADGLIDDLAASGAADAAGAAVAQAWNWWATLFDVYAWTGIGAFLTPFLLLIIVGMFWAITRLHLQG
ncbi:hypothetical protein [Inquilinus sp. CAU 1745]|uniref:hypothetical protein n=1 Tax=Inquilinus sp. CAU 1745 TaxID=3140369 RepID=UPI00325A6DF9